MAENGVRILRKTGALGLVSRDSYRAFGNSVGSARFVAILRRVPSKL